MRKLFKGGNYSREETIQGRKIYEEIRYSNFKLRIVFWNNFLGSLGDLKNESYFLKKVGQIQIQKLIFFPNLALVEFTLTKNWVYLPKN